MRLFFKKQWVCHSLALLLAALTGCAEQFIEAPFVGETDDTPLTQSPKAAFSDGFSGFGTVAFRRTLEVQWSRTKGVSSWCVSETQSQPPILACDGGQGLEGGWSKEPPTSFTLSSAPGNKVVYVWVRDTLGNLIPAPTAAGVALIPSSVLVPFDNGSGSTVSDLNGLSFFFSLGNSGRWMSNRAVELDGVRSFVDLGTPAELRYTSSFTILGWVKSSQAGGQILVGRYDPNSSNRAYHFHFTPSAFQFEVSKDGSSTVGMSARVTADYVAKQFQNKWRHFAGVYESKTDGTSRVTLYVDGVKVDESNTGPASILDPSGLKVLVGISADETSYPLKGQVGALAFLPAAVPQSVVQAVYLLQKPSY